MKINGHISLATLATVLLSLPVVSLAADNQEKDQHGAGQRNEQQQARPQQQANPQQQSRPQQQANPQQPSRPQQQANPQQQNRPQQQANPQHQSRPQQQANPQQQGRPQQQANPQQQSRPQQQANPQQQFRPGQQAGPAGSSPTAVATRHVQQSNQWRSARSNWNGNAVWQSNPNWWRGNVSFRGYTGPRMNSFYAPGFGYYSVPQEYWGRSWNTGAYLPLFFLRYVVNDYQAYGLPPPPYGCSWVWVNTSVVLVDMSDGYILDEIDNVW